MPVTTPIAPRGAMGVFGKDGFVVLLHDKSEY